jgi:dTDP-4-dehydrorhamnose reductase
MKLLLLGNTGQLGWELQRTLQPLGKVAAFDYPEIDMADAGSIREIVRGQHPHVIINATAYTAVDKVESKPGLAQAINGSGPGVLAEEACKINAALVHYSTDYVFDGKKDSPYVETDLPQPLNVYGQSKLAGEHAIQAVDGTYLILRTAWVYSLRRDCFVNKVLGWARQEETLRIVDDQVSNPTWARMLAETTAQILARGGANLPTWMNDCKGLYHLAGNGFTSRYAWAKKILELDPNPESQVCKEILPVLSDEFPTPAKRPLHSALDCTKFMNRFGLQMPHWAQALDLAMQEITPLQE